MILCPNCECEITNHHKFCSQSCSTIFNNKIRGPRSEETKRKISLTLLRKHVNRKRTDDEILKAKVSAQKVGKKLKDQAERNLLLEPFETLKFERIRKRVFLEQNKKCNCCKLDTWMNKPISYELNHIDGDNKNNQRFNLEALCPNCHSMTDTWRGRNKKNRGFVGKKVSNELLLETLLLHNWNMRQALLELNLAAKGGNYKRCHFLKREYFN